MNGFKNDFLKHLNRLSSDDRILFDRIYKYWEAVGKLVPPREMISWIESQFGNIKSVTKQDFIKITNIVTHEGAVFNDLRTKRVVVENPNTKSVIDEIEDARDGPFSHPITGTPADTFGRIKGKYCVTASNVAKYDGLHGLIIYNEHNPLLFSRKRVRDYFSVARRWFEKAHKSNNKAIYPMYTWNCLWKAGASVIHGHSQLVLTEGQAYAKVDALRIFTHKYQEQYQSNYFDDDYRVHEAMGLGFEVNNIKVIAKLTPIKEKEVMLMYNANKCDATLADTVSDILTTMKEKLGVVSFNLSIVLPPLTETPEIWTHMPIIVRIVDRGSLTSQTADVGVMELYAQSIIGSNPYLVTRELKSALLK